MESLNFKSSVAGLAVAPPRRSRSCTFSKNRVGFRVFAEGAGADPDLSVTVNGLKMPNPFVIGSGPPGTNYTVMKRAFDEGWGAVIAKTVCSFLITTIYNFKCFMIFFLIDSLFDPPFL